MSRPEVSKAPSCGYEKVRLMMISPATPGSHVRSSSYTSRCFRVMPGLSVCSACVRKYLVTIVLSNCPRAALAFKEAGAMHSSVPAFQYDLKLRILVVSWPNISTRFSSDEANRYQFFLFTRVTWQSLAESDCRSSRQLP